MVKIIVGLMGSSVASGSSKMASAQQMETFFRMLKQHGVRELDTARVYNEGKSEELIGSLSDFKRDFGIATKAPGFSPGSLAYQKVVNSCNASLAALNLNKIDLYYFHGPDREVPLEESCRAINDLRQQDKFDRFGISNFNKDEVQEIYEICERNAWILPTVYQGGYNPISRTAERELFPTLRKLGIAFYAYSPLAGGFFSRATDELRNPPVGGRMDQMKVFKSLYVNDVSLKLHEDLTETCKHNGLTMKEATLRWIIHHSALTTNDGVILGGSSEQQMDDNLRACEGDRLPGNVVEAFDKLHGEFSKEGNVPYCV